MKRNGTQVNNVIFNELKYINMNLEKLLKDAYMSGVTEAQIAEQIPNMHLDFDGMANAYAKQQVKNNVVLPDVSNRAGEFAVWLNANRWFNYEKGKWHYTFEHGTAMSTQDYEKNYMKTHEELYAIFCKEHGY